MSTCKCDSATLRFFLPIVLAFICVLVLFAVGFAVAMPYGYIRHISEDTTQCTVKSVIWQSDKRPPCDCGTVEVECQNTYPCALIMVDYVSIHTGRHVENATLFHLPYQYYHLKTDQCSTIHCDQNAAENDRFVRDFVRSYGVVNKTFPCYPGQDSNPEALLSVIEHWKVLLGMLLPAAIFIISVTVIILNAFCKR